MQSAEIEKLLPAVFQRSLEAEHSPLRAMLAVMEGLHSPTEDRLARLATFFDPDLAPAAFVAYLASWLDMDYTLSDSGNLDPAAARYSLASGSAALRDLVARGAELIAKRGTAGGMKLFLETATGIGGFNIEETVTGPENLPVPFHIRVQIPAAAEQYRDLIDVIVQEERPAHITYELATASDSAAPATPPSASAVASTTSAHTS